MAVAATLPVEDQVQAQMAARYCDAYAKIVHGLQPQFHHLPWYDALQEIAENDWHTRIVPIEERCFVVVAPPGAAKSTVISQIFPPWYLGRHPDHHVIFLTAADTSATRFNTTIKGVLEANEKHQLVFPDERCRPDMSRGWSGDGLYLQGSPKMDKEPAFLATGWGANIVGNRAHGIILDDPLTQEQAESPVVQEAAKDYIKGTVIPRMFDKPNSWIVLVTTRWHENDLGGFCAAPKDKGGLGWRLIHLKALDKFAWSPRDAHGDVEESSCWEDHFPTPRLVAMQAMDPAKFECVTGETRVQSVGRITRVYRRWYTGPVTQIATIRGDHLTCTPNHPILTSKGWVPAHELTDADDLVCEPSFVETPRADQNVDTRHPTIAEIFDLAAVAGRVESTPMTSDDFHGDGSDEYVETVAVDRELAARFEALLAQPRHHLLLTSPETEATRSSAERQHRGGLWTALVACTSPPDVFGMPRAVQPLRLTQAAEGDAGLPQMVPDGPVLQAIRPRDVGRALPIGIASDRIGHIDHHARFVGHVYNLETTSNAFYANNILTHNCVYQGNPLARGADIFRREWFKPLPLDWNVKGEDGKTHADRCSLVQFWDLAFGDKTFNDFTACITLAYDGTRFFVVHVLHVKVRLLVEAADDNMKGLGGTMARHIIRMRPNVIGVEAGAFNMSATVRRLVFRVQQLLKDEEMAAVVNLVKAEKDKVRRAELPAQEAKAGFVHVDQNQDWWPDFVAELVAFPAATHDDQVDAFSGAVQAAIEAGTSGEGRGKNTYGVREPEKPPSAQEWDWLRELQDQYADELAALALVTGGRFR